MTIVVVAVICFYVLAFHDVVSYPEATDWFNRYYREPLSWRRAVQNFLLINVSLNPVAWTLMVEMAIACVFPLLHRIARGSSAAVNASVFVMLVALAFFAGWFRSLAPENQVYVLFCEVVLPHAYKFYLGLLLPMYVTTRFVETVAANAIWYFAGAILVADFARPCIPRWGGAVELAILVESLAAACLLAPFCLTADHGIGTRLLQNRAIRWLGRVSYSFYLWHFITLYVLATLMLNHLPGDLLAAHAFAFAILLAVCSIAITGLASQLTYEHVEIKFMNYGRNLTRSIALRSKMAIDA